MRLRVVERGSSQPVPARLHLHGAAGEYLPPRGHHRRVSGYWFDDNFAEFVNGRNAYSYIPGECVVDLPLGEVFVEASRGYEVLPAGLNQVRDLFDVVGTAGQPEGDRKEI